MDPIIDYQTGQSTAVTASRFMTRVYGWMTFGLLITAIVAYVVGSDPAIMQAIISNHLMGFAMIVQIGLVLGISFGINRISVGTATFLFLLYSFVTGITFSILFIAYSLGTLGQTFAITAGAFGGLALYGAVTKRDLTAMGTFMRMGLFGLIIAMFSNFFFKSAALNGVIPYLGVLIFAGLTAYDVQKIRSIGLSGRADTDEGHKFAILGALTLYLDFINLFIFMLQILGGNGRRRDY